MFKQPVLTSLEFPIIRVLLNSFKFLVGNIYCTFQATSKQIYKTYCLYIRLQQSCNYVAKTIKTNVLHWRLQKRHGATSIVVAGVWTGLLLVVGHTINVAHSPCWICRYKSVLLPASQQLVLVRFTFNWLIIGVYFSNVGVYRRMQAWSIVRGRCSHRWRMLERFYSPTSVLFSTISAVWLGSSGTTKQCPHLKLSSADVYGS